MTKKGFKIRCVRHHLKCTLALHRGALVPFGLLSSSCVDPCSIFFHTNFEGGMPASSPHITNGADFCMKKNIFSQPKNARTRSAIYQVACHCDAQACRVPSWTLSTATGPPGVCQRLQKTTGASWERRASEQVTIHMTTM